MITIKMIILMTITCGVWLADWPGERAGNGGVPAG